jgi:hypothetical protein
VLKRLTIDLNATSCGYGWTCQDEKFLRFCHDDEGESPELAAAQSETIEIDGEQDDRQPDFLGIFEHSQSQPLTSKNDLHTVSTKQSRSHSLQG